MQRLLGLVPPLMILLLATPTASGDTPSGYVLDGDGKPMKGVTVRVVTPQPVAEEISLLVRGESVPTVALVETDDAGRFAIDAEENRVLELIIQLPDFVPVRERILSGAPIPPIRLERAGMQRGRVTADGQPVAGARLLWYGGTGGDAFTFVCTTDEGGNFEVPDPKAWSTAVLVLHPDGRAAIEYQPGWSQAGLEFELAKASPVAVHVVGEAGDDVAGASVSAAPLPAIETDDAGLARVSVASRNVAIRAVAGNLVGAGSPKNGTLMIKLRDAASLTGTVTRTGATISGARVTIIARQSGLRLDAVTDAEGRYAIERIPAGSYYATANAPGVRFDMEPSIFTLRSSEAEERDFDGSSEGSMSGIVQNQDGEPVVGAVVRGFPIGWLERTGSSSRTAFLLRGGPAPIAITASDGSFTIRGSWKRLIAVHDDWASALTDELASEDGEETTEITITMTSGIPLSGVVVDPDGAPLGDVRIALVEGRSGGYLESMAALSRQNGAVWPTTETDGTFRFHLNPMVHSIAFHRDGYQVEAIEPLDLEVGVDPMRITLRPGLALTGQVLWSDGSSPAGLSVMISGNAGIAPVTLAEDGLFRFEGLTPGDAQLLVGSIGEGVHEQRSITIPASDVLVELNAGRTLTIIVTDEDTGEFLKEISGSLESVGGLRDGMRTFDSDGGTSDGTATLRHVKPGAYRVDVRATDYVARESDIFEVSADTDARVDVTLVRGRTIRGSVRDASGAPVPSASISHGWTSSAPDADGEFDIGGVSRKEATLEISAEGFVTEEVELEPGSGDQRIAVVLERGLSVPGSIHSESGEPIADAWIWAASSDMQSMVNAQTDEDGTFELSGLTAGSWQVSVNASGYDRLSERLFDPSVDTRLDLVLETEQTGIVFGLISGLDGDALARTFVTADYGSDRAVPDESGRYRIEGVPAGDVNVQARVAGPDGGRSVSSKAVVRPDVETAVDLQFNHGVTVSGRVTRAGRPAPHASVRFDGGEAASWATADVSGRYSIENLPPAQYEIEVSDGRDSFSKSMAVETTQTIDLELSGALVRGRVVSRATGEPIPGAEIEIEPAATELRYVSNKSVETGLRGEFALEGLMGGDFVVRCEHEDFGQQIARVRLVEGETASVDFVLDKNEGIHVRVIDARSGASLSGTVAVRDMSNLVVYDGNPPQSGEGLQVPIAPGTYKLSASASGYATQTVRVTVPGPEVTVSLMPGGTLVVLSETGGVTRRMKLVMPDGEEYVQCWCNRISEFLVKDKRTTFENVAAGNYTMVLTHPDGGVETVPVTVLEGESLEVRVR